MELWFPDKGKRHYKILKQLPGPYIRNALEETKITEMTMLLEAMNIYSNERFLLLNGLIDHPNNPNNANSSSKKLKSSGGDNASSSSVDQWRTFRSSSSLSGKSFNRVTDLEDLKAIFKYYCSSQILFLQPHTGIDGSQESMKKLIGSTSSKTDLGEVTHGCDECTKANKKKKLSEDKSSYLHGYSPNPPDNEETWWMKKGLKPLKGLKTDPPLKLAKQASRCRQKVVCKAAKIEGSQGAYTSHDCDSYVRCIYPRNSFDGAAPNSLGGIRTSCSGDIVSIGKV